MICPYCESEMDVAALRALDADMAKSQESEEIVWDYDGGSWLPNEQQGMAVYSCHSCSGEIVGDQTLGATTCPFCGNPVVMTSRFSGTLRPDLVIPFKLGKDAALSALEKHYLGKRLLPKSFKDRNHLNEVKGVYVPFWLFDANTYARITYKATKVRSWSDRSYNYVETSTFNVIREGGLSFDGVPVDGSKAIDDPLMESIEPYALRDAVGFQTAYLAGYFANKYDVTSSECTGRANERVSNSTVSAFARTVVGYNTVAPLTKNVTMSSGRVRYALLPVWMLGTTWQERSFIFAMNGQTGKFVGDLPVDKKEKRRWFWKIFLIAAALLVLIPQIVMLIMWGGA